MFKKTICAIICILCVFLAVSCGAKQPEIVPEFETEQASNDMNGEIFSVLTDWTVDDPFDLGIDTAYGDMMNVRIQDVESMYNCVLDYKASSSDIVTYVSGSVAAAALDSDLYYGRYTETFCFANYLFPLDSVPDIVDCTDSNKYGTPNLLEYSMANGVHYGVVPVMWPSKITSANIGPLMVIGEDLIRSYGRIDPRDYHEQGEWTLQKLDEVTSDYYINDGERVIKAFIGSDANFSCGIFGSVGMKMVVERENGTLTAGYNTQAMIDVIAWAQDYTQRHKDEIDITGSWESYKDVANGDTFMACMSSYIANISKGLDNFGIVPFPYDSRYLSSGEQNLYFDFFNSLGIFASSDYPEASAVILSALCEPFEGYYSNWDELTDFLNRTLFFDPRDGASFINMIKHAVNDYNQCGGYTAFAPGALASDYLILSPAEAVSKYENAQDTIIEKYIAGNYDYMKEYWQNN